MKTPHWPVTLGYKPIDLGLERMREILKRLGNPEQKLPPVIHVAGTNGKGSLVAFLKSIFEAAGYKVHSYTSPHLVHFNERISLAGTPISDNYLTDIMEECRQNAEGIKLTFFEGTTAGAFLAFSRVPADIVLLEVGMGGRLDATNVVDNPMLTAITPVSFDHMKFLGDTVAKIAYEKAGIIKKNTLCVVGPQVEEAYHVIHGVAEELSSPTFSFGKDWIVEGNVYRSENMTFEMPKLPLYGEHQYLNAGTAIACIERLGFGIQDSGFSVIDHQPLTINHIRTGLSNAIWPARMQKLKYGPVVDMLKNGSEIWLDGGHNEAGGMVIAEIAEGWKNSNDLPLYVIAGMSEGKETVKFFAPFAEYIAHCYAIALPEEILRQSREEVADAAKSVGINASIAENYEEAVRDIVNKNKGRAVRILICGSLYLAGTVLEENG